MAFQLSTEALARGSARRPWTVIGAWVLILVAAFVAIGALLSDSLTTEVGFTNNPESKRAETLLEERLRGPDQTNEIVIVRSGEKTVDDAEFQDTVESVYGGVIGLGAEIVEGGTNFYQSGDETLVSADRHTTILPFVMAGDHEDALDNIPSGPSGGR